MLKYSFFSLKKKNSSFCQHGALRITWLSYFLWFIACSCSLSLAEEGPMVYLFSLTRGWSSIGFWFRRVLCYRKADDLVCLSPILQGFALSMVFTNRKFWSLGQFDIYLGKCFLLAVMFLLLIIIPLSCIPWMVNFFSWLVAFERTNNIDFIKKPSSFLGLCSAFFTSWCFWILAISDRSVRLLRISRWNSYRC